MFLDERVAFHRSHPAADSKLALQSRFIELDVLQNFRVFVTDRSNVGREPVDCDHAFRRGEGGECLHETPGRIRNDRAPLRVQIGVRTKRPKL